MISGSPTPEGRANPSAARFISVHLLIALALLFFASPFIQELPSAKVIQRFLIAVVFLSALFAVAGRGSFVAGSLLAAAALIGPWVGFFLPAVAPYSLLPAIAFLVFVISRVLGYILSPACNSLRAMTGISGSRRTVGMSAGSSTPVLWISSRNADLSGDGSPFPAAEETI